MLEYRSLMGSLHESQNAFAAQSIADPDEAQTQDRHLTAMTTADAHASFGCLLTPLADIAAVDPRQSAGCRSGGESAFPGDARLALGVGFIAAQALLGYSTSGIAKLVSPVWRDGTGLAGILSTIDHGTPALGQWLARHPTLSTLASWRAIAFECAFVLVLVLPPPLAAGMLMAGLAFHAACATFMGLTSFMWAFPATYPWVWVAAEFLRGLASG